MATTRKPKEKTMSEQENASGAQVPCLSLLDIVAEIEKTMLCNCDLDNWEPERNTGHTRVCRIHKAAKVRRSQVLAVRVIGAAKK